MGQELVYSTAVMHKAQQVVMPVTSYRVGEFRLESSLEAGEYLVASMLEPEQQQTKIGQSRIPLLAHGEVAYVGQPIALLLAPTLWQAHVAREKLAIHYPAHSTSASLQLSPFLRKKVVPTSQSDHFFVQRNVKKGFDLEYIFSTAHQTFSQKYHVDRRNLELENELGVFAGYEDGKVIVYLASIWSNRIRIALMRLFDLSCEELEIRQLPRTAQEDGFDLHVHLGACYVVWALLHTGKSTRLIWAGSRPFFSSNVGGDLQLELELALDSEQALLAVRCRAIFDAGAYAIGLDEVIDRMIWALGVRYRKAALGVEIKARQSAQEPALPDATFGVSAINYALEHALATIYQRPSHRTIREWTHFLYGKGDIDLFDHEWRHDTSYIALIKRLYAISGYPRKYDAYQREASAREAVQSSEHLQHYRGIGLALAELPSGFLRHLYAPIRMEMTLTPAHCVEIRLNVGGQRASLLTYWRGLVSRMLQIDRQLVEFMPMRSLSSDKKESPCDEDVAGMLGGNVHMVTAMLQDACEEIQKRRFREGLPISVALVDKRYRKWKDRHFEGDLSERVSRAAVVSEVEVDSKTMNVYTRAIYLVVDAGKILLPEQARNQVALEVEQTLKQLSVRKEHGGEQRDYANASLVTTTLYPQRLQIEFLEKRQNIHSKSRGLSGLVQSILPVAHLLAISQALQRSISHLSLQNESIFVQYQWLDMMLELQQRRRLAEKVEEQ
ncbi:molybdopterin cofactor-binding domain-containing protein [Entomospira culicis]|uniref:Xanthine dehydrogenase family protein molybdopterin-binding subunit n=1 Tax=Entomospira culicis TaxID=2719989 RepID=A0A968KU18_9SPIO|nr:molybdopterin cofactor-binding domain-containing protein [Entomospira culicis]NIZ18834.1 xanthine dehydrogenase family protein molybdopterin-binding subunit [Entomospira culicis]NIZ69049.1 xanthine dehydrogenase family protein molybdopterin-binding subunit [Entomospira culicis]WDI37637.1 molybdopterin-dependent oxidoreductase [Entomospira culicis]WDI39265.1 molybdopterin-dependent oxidoreductase [Entomospira culicis]